MSGTVQSGLWIEIQVSGTVQSGMWIEIQVSGTVQSGCGLRSRCLGLCNQGCQSQCQAFNYRKTTELCELFYYEPCSYDVQQDCVNFQVVGISRLVSFEDSY